MISPETAARGCPKCEPYELDLVKDTFNLWLNRSLMRDS